MAAIRVQMQAIVMASPDRTDAIGLLVDGYIEPRGAHRRGTRQPCRPGTDDDRIGFPQYVLRKRALSRPPHFLRHVDREFQLRPLFFLAEDVALFGGSKAALRRYRKLIQRRVFGGFLQPALD